MRSRWRRRERKGENRKMMYRTRRSKSSKKERDKKKEVLEIRSGEK